MKRILIPGLMLVAALALTNCSEQLETPLQENDIVVEETMGALSEDCVPYEVFVESAETKTNYQDGRTSWIENVDEIALFHKKTDGKYQYHSKFVYTGAGAFRGNLVNSETLADKNDWYAIYPYNSSSADTISVYPVTIGGELQTQTQAGSMYDIAGPNCPLYGIKNGVSRKNAPKFKMSHMFAVVALNIVNKGHGGDIVVRSAGITAPEEIVGSFNVNILGDPAKNIYDPIFTKTDAKKQTTANLSSPAKIVYNESATIYLAVKPFDASNKELKISVNGSTRAVKMPAGTKFEAGKITTISVPVYPLSFPTESDALEAKTASNENMLTLNSKTDRNVCANGEVVSAYELGNGANESLTIYGKTSDMVNALDVGFFASTWKDKPAAMTVSNIQVWFPHNGSLVKLSEYTPLKEVLKTELKGDISWDFTGFLTSAAIELVLGSLSDGVPRDKDSSLDFVYLTRFIDPQSITFNGIISNGVPMPATSSEIANVVILDEEPLYKEIKGTTVDNLFKTRFAYTDKTTKVTTYPTFAGLVDIVNGTNTSGEADVTAQTLYNKLYDTVASKGTLKMDAAGNQITINMASVFNALIPSVDALKEMLPGMKFQITITTCPYHADKAKGYGTKASPKAIKDITGDKNPIVFWGFDVYADNSSK